MIVNLRFINEQIIVITYEPHEIENIYINDVKAEHVQCEHVYSNWTHIYTASSNEWKKLDNIDVFIDGKFIKNVKKTFTENHNLVAMTLFKEDSKLIQGYVNYYKKLGVEKFFMYYNKKLGVEKLPEIENVIYIEWDYPYRKEDGNENGYCFAQPTAINDFLYWSKHFSKFVLFNDLDEYIDEYFINKLDDEHICFAFENQFIELYDTKQDDNIYNKIKNNEFRLLNNLFDFPVRSKCVVVPKKVITMGVHELDKQHLDTGITKIIGKFYHVNNFENRQRTT